VLFPVPSIPSSVMKRPRFIWFLSVVRGPLFVALQQLLFWPRTSDRGQPANASYHSELPANKVPCCRLLKNLWRSPRRQSRNPRKTSPQRGGAATKHVGPNGVRPWGERRSPLLSSEKSSRRGKKIGISNTEATEFAEKSGCILLYGLCALCGGSFLRGLRW